MELTNGDRYGSVMQGGIVDPKVLSDKRIGLIFRP